MIFQDNFQRKLSNFQSKAAAGAFSITSSRLTNHEGKVLMTHMDELSQLWLRSWIDIDLRWCVTCAINLRKKLRRNLKRMNLIWSKNLNANFFYIFYFTFYSVFCLILNVYSCNNFLLLFLWNIYSYPMILFLFSKCGSQMGHVTRKFMHFYDFYSSLSASPTANLSSLSFLLVFTSTSLISYIWMSFNNLQSKKCFSTFPLIFFCDKPCLLELLKFIQNKFCFLTVCVASLKMTTNEQNFVINKCHYHPTFMFIMTFSLINARCRHYFEQ